METKVNEQPYRADGRPIRRVVYSGKGKKCFELRSQDSSGRWNHQGRKVSPRALMNLVSGERFSLIFDQGILPIYERYVQEMRDRDEVGSRHYLGKSPGTQAIA